jgi:hypothetical protein
MHACGFSESFAATSLIIEMAGSGDRSSRSDQAPRVTNFLIEMIGGVPAGTDQKRLHARIDHNPRFFVRVKMQRFQALNQTA